jgi:hypothetical protein
LLLHRVAQVLMLASLAVMALAWWYRDALPPPGELSPEIVAEPRQAAIQEPAFDTTVNGVRYRIQPRFIYELTGLVVSLHDSDTWWDYAHKEWGDHINLVDLCVVWGDNVRRDVYREAKFWNSQWECWASIGGTRARDFAASAMSNNHVITDDLKLGQALREVRIGDQVRLRGFLADYTIHKDGQALGPRVSSSVRTDSGPGACEIIYLGDISLIRGNGHAWALAFKIALGVLIASIVGYFALPVRFDD